MAPMPESYVLRNRLIGEAEANPETGRYDVTLYHADGSVAREASFRTMRGAERVVYAWSKNRTVEFTATYPGNAQPRTALYGGGNV